MNSNPCFACLVILLCTASCATLAENEASGRFIPGNDTEGTKPALQVRDDSFPEARMRLNNVGIIDDSLRYKIAIEATNSRRTETQTLEVWAQIRNRTDYPLQIECHVLFFDQNHAPVDKPTTWQRTFLEPNAIAIFKEMSTSIQDIAFYYIEIREGR